MPMTPEIVIALLAIAKIGAVALPLFSGYGATAITNRLKDAQATGLFTADGFVRRGKVVDMKSIADKSIQGIPSIKNVIVLRHTQSEINMQPGRDLTFDDLIKDQPEHAETTILDSEANLMILYTSGTTGRPKGAVHTHCGFPVKAAQDMAFGTDVHASDVIYWMTDMGWMMGPWLVYGALILGGTSMLYDGAPDYPDHERIWSLCASHGVNVLGVSPTLIRALMPHGAKGTQEFDLSRIRCFGSTGEPWNPTPWRWLFNEIGGSLKPIINYSGGTEISGGILMGNPITPLKACAFSAPCPGISVDVFNENGESLRGDVGELVIKAPWIGMTRGFWNDNERYEQTYWSRWENIWVHGDFAAVDEDGSWYIFGRSDDTLKVAGKRIGPAEVESILVQAEGVIEAAVIGIPDDIKGNSIIAFCVIDEGTVPDQKLATQLAQHVIDGMGKPMAPKAVHFLPDLPKTRNAKVMRRMLRAAYLGDTLGETSALVNPEILENVSLLDKGG
jgi:acetyl-CoA synthetase